MRCACGRLEPGRAAVCVWGGGRGDGGALRHSTVPYPTVYTGAQVHVVHTCRYMQLKKGSREDHTPSTPAPFVADPASLPPLAAPASSATELLRSWPAAAGHDRSAEVSGWEAQRALRAAAAAAGPE